MRATLCYNLFLLLFLSTFIQFFTDATNSENQYPTITLRYPETNQYRYPEKRIVIIITSYKNKDWYRTNLDSVYSQNYSNYRVIYMDDNSPDGTGALVQEYLKEKGQEHRTTLIRHTEWQSQMGNHYNAAHLCDDDEIVCHLDGDDYLYNPQTLQIINAIYQDENVWMTLGLPIKSDTNQLCTDSIPEKQKQEMTATNSFRTNGGWPYSHLRTFRAWLFKQIRLEDLMYKGNFANLSPCPDVAMGYPMLEMAGFHNRVVTNRLYVWNVKNPISQRIITPLDKIVSVDSTIRLQWPAYKPLAAPIINYSDTFNNKKCDVIVISENTDAIQNTQCIIAESITNIDKIYFVPDSATNFVENLQAAIRLCPSHWIILTTENPLFSHAFDASEMIKELERTFAYTFHLHRQLIPELSTLKGFLTNNIIAWQPNYTKHIWPNPEQLGTILYRKKDILSRISLMNAINCAEFKKMWATYSTPERTVCLFYRY